MKAIIIGCRGFIGKHLTDYMKDKGHEVWGADVIVDYSDSNRYFIIDESNADFSSVFADQNYELCINCSGAASVADSMKNPMRDYYLNTLNVFKLLEVIRKYQPKCKFVNLSSAAVYGNPERLPVREEYMAAPVSPYGIHKLQAEHICMEFNQFYNIPTCSLRIFSVYGAGLQKQLFWDLYKKAKAGAHFNLFGTGNESRDFINISDLVRAIDLVYKSSSFKADVINIANGEEISIKDAVAIFLSFFKQDIPFSFSGEIKKGDPLNWVADIKRLREYGYDPLIDIKTGLQKYYDWAEEQKPE